MTFASKRFNGLSKRIRALIVALSIALPVVAAQAQQTSTTDQKHFTSAKPAQLPSPSSGLPRIQAVRITEALKIDGLLDEPAWSLVQPATDFRQERPTEGAPASERTEVRVLFDDKNIYFGIRAFDSEASHINARDLVLERIFPLATSAHFSRAPSSALRQPSPFLSCTSFISLTR